jgi:PIN domain nuclease of toxin-antitoxin system
LTLLLDTHVLLWLLAAPERLSVAAGERIADEDTDVFVSVVSLWEIVVKRRVGKLDADVAAITAQLHPNSKLRWLGVAPKHLLTLDGLNAAEGHRDPFDHLLIAQAIAEGMTFMTRDGRARHYPVTVLAA